MWKVTAGRKNASAEEFLDRGYVAIGWSEAGDYTAVESRNALIQLFHKTWPENTDTQNIVGAGQAWRFLRVFKKGERVITYNSDERRYYVGTISGDPVYNADSNEWLPIQRQVRWEGGVLRDDLSQASRNTLGAIMTLFKLSDAAAVEIEKRLAGQPLPEAISVDETRIEERPEESVEVDPYADIESLAFERVKDVILSLGWEDMQDLVAALLRALGYRTIVSTKGADRGRDIIASRDGFGFERPRIVVEVKHRKGQMGAPEVRSFLQTLHHEDRGLYVSTGGFSKEAYYQAENANSVTHLMAIDGLTGALLQQYEKLDEEGKVLLSLRKIYWPI